MEDNQIINLIALGVEIGYTRARIDLGDLKPYVCLAEAHAKYGRRMVDGWITEENSTVIVIKGANKNSKFKIDRLQLELRAAFEKYNIANWEIAGHTD
jgi:hypothetical protein